MMRVLVAVLVFALAGCVDGLQDDNGSSWQAGDPVPRVTMAKDSSSSGVTFTVTEVADGPLPHNDVVIVTDGCDWTHAVSSVVTVGDIVTCTSDDVLTLAHGPSGGTVYSNCGGCSVAPGDDGDDLGGDETVSSFPQARLSEGAVQGQIDVEHRGGDCIDLSNYEFRVEGTEAEGADSGNFCIGDTLTLSPAAGEPSWDGQTVTVTVTQKDTQTIVYENDITL